MARSDRSPTARWRTEAEPTWLAIDLREGERQYFAAGAKRALHAMGDAPWLRSPSARAVAFGALTPDDFEILLIRAAGLLRRLPADQRRFSAAGQSAGTWLAPPASQRRQLLAETLDAAQEVVQSSLTPLQRSLENAALLLGGGIELIHALPGGNGRALRLVTYLLVNGYAGDATAQEAISHIVEKGGRQFWPVGAPALVPALVDAAQTTMVGRTVAPFPDDPDIFIALMSAGMDLRTTLTWSPTGHLATAQVVARHPDIADHTLSSKDGAIVVDRQALITHMTPEIAGELVSADEGFRSGIVRIFLASLKHRVIAPGSLRNHASGDPLDVHVARFRSACDVVHSSLNSPRTEIG